MLDGYLTLSQAATRLALTRQRVWDLARLGVLQGQQIGDGATTASQWLVTAASVDAYRASRRRPGRPRRTAPDAL